MLTGLLTRRLRERSWFKNLLHLCEHYFNISEGLAVNKAAHTKNCYTSTTLCVLYELMFLLLVRRMQNIATDVVKTADNRGCFRNKRNCNYCLCPRKTNRWETFTKARSYGRAVVNRLHCLVARQIDAAGEANTRLGEAGQISDGEERQLLFFDGAQTQTESGA